MSYILALLIPLPLFLAPIPCNSYGRSNSYGHNPSYALSIEVPYNIKTSRIQGVFGKTLFSFRKNHLFLQAPHINSLSLIITPAINHLCQDGTTYLERDTRFDYLWYELTRSPIPNKKATVISSSYTWDIKPITDKVHVRIPEDAIIILLPPNVIKQVTPSNQQSGNFVSYLPTIHLISITEDELDKALDDIDFALTTLDTSCPKLSEPPRSKTLLTVQTKQQ